MWNPPKVLAAAVEKQLLLKTEVAGAKVVEP